MQFIKRVFLSDENGRWLVRMRRQPNIVGADPSGKFKALGASTGAGVPLLLYQNEMPIFF